jgi:hypothetical protein
MRLNREDSVLDAIGKLSKGNPGATRVLTKLLSECDSFVEWSTIMVLLDELNIYGSEIWLLYKDVCECDIAKVITALRSCQLGLITHDELHDAILGLEHLSLVLLAPEVKKILQSE